MPAVVIRVLISLYTGHMVRVSWAGFASDYFKALNGVKQGGIISPVLFCVYIDQLLINLASSGVGCYVGLNFVGALAYADDIVLLAPTPTAMRKLLSICDIYALKYDIIFNATKSKFLVVIPGIRRSLQNILSGIVFYVGGSVIEYVESYVHLGHIITSKITDEEDILQRRNCFVGQVNNVLCFFRKLDMFTKIKLFKSFCTSFFWL